MIVESDDWLVESFDRGGDSTANVRNSAQAMCFDTALGPCGIAWRCVSLGAAPFGIERLQLPEASADLTKQRLISGWSGRWVDCPPHEIACLIRRIQQHLLGVVLDDFQDVVLSLPGASMFARQVYAAARTIPPGGSLSYGSLARRIARPGAARAVGQVLGKNPVGLIIPCHRVLAAGQRIGGFSAHGGVETKMRLLAIEGGEFSSARHC